MLLPFKRSQKIFIHELLLGAVDKTLIDKFDGRGWIREVKEYLLDCSKIKTVGLRAENNRKNTVVGVYDKMWK
jgi:hypothetical protein